MKLVLAGNYREFKSKYPTQNKEIRYIANIESIIGFHNVEVERIGTWYERDYELIAEVNLLEGKPNADTGSGGSVEEICK